MKALKQTWKNFFNSTPNSETKQNTNESAINKSSPLVTAASPQTNHSEVPSLVGTNISNTPVANGLVARTPNVIAGSEIEMRSSSFQPIKKSTFNVILGNIDVPDEAEFRVQLNSKETPKDPKFAFNKDQYIFTRKLGQGSYGTVSAATHVEEKCEVAIKRIAKSRMLKRPQQSEQLRRELQILSKLRHPHLLGLMDWGFSASNIFIVTELASGGELFDWIISKGRFFEHDACKILVSLCDAVGYMHEHGVVHRDLKPENIFMRDENRVDHGDLVIGDFGVSRILGSDKKFMKTLMGSPGYMAPEILQRNEYGTPCDMWSIGVIAYILVTGTTPYPPDSGNELESILNHPIIPQLPNWRGATANARDFCIRLLTVVPSRRMTAHEALNHIWLTDSEETSEDLFSELAGLIENEKAQRPNELELRRSGTNSSNASTSSNASGSIGGG